MVKQMKFKQLFFIFAIIGIFITPKQLIVATEHIEATINQARYILKPTNTKISWIW